MPKILFIKHICSKKIAVSKHSVCCAKNRGYKGHVCHCTPEIAKVRHKAQSLLLLQASTVGSLYGYAKQNQGGLSVKCFMTLFRIGYRTRFGT